MARSTVAQTIQIAREVTPGTTPAAGAFRKTNALSIAMNPSVESEANAVKGNKYPTIVENRKEWSEGDLEGSATYDEIIYPLASVFSAPTTAQVMDGATPTGVYEHTFSPATSGADSPITLTVEEGMAAGGGDPAIAERANYCLVTEFGLAMSRSEVSMDGSLVGQRLTSDTALTAGATPIATDLVPILPGQISVFSDPTFGALGTTRLGQALSVEASIGGRYNPVWYLNALFASFATHVETPDPEFTLDLMVEANAAGFDWLARYRDGATRFVRVQADGPQVYGGASPAGYRLQWDFAVKVLEPGEKSDEDGVYALAPTLQVVHDPAWGRASQIKVRNKVTAL